MSTPLTPDPGAGAHIESPVPGEPRRPSGPRDPGDAWVVSPTGERYWGRFGAAGLLAWDPARGVLLQHRVAWSHHGGTWGVPGGARLQGESAARAALRESGEEAGVPAGAILPLGSILLDLEFWTYTTLIGQVTRPFEPVIADPESVALEWVPVGEVERRPLHPGFASAWSALREWLRPRPVLLIDAANVVGSVPDGWWRDRAGATRRLRGRVAALAREGLPAGSIGLSGERGFVDPVLVVEGAARKAAEPVPEDDGVHVVAAEGSGDDEIVAQALAWRQAGRDVLAITSDRELRGRLECLAAEVSPGGSVTVQGARWLGDRLDALPRG